MDYNTYKQDRRMFLRGVLDPNFIPFLTEDELQRLNKKRIEFVRRRLEGLSDAEDDDDDEDDETDEETKDYKDDEDDYENEDDEDDEVEFIGIIENHNEVEFVREVRARHN